MNKDIRKTFINPIVVPDYPVLGAKRSPNPDEGMAAMRDPSQAWGRGAESKSPTTASGLRPSTWQLR